jgi:hypothetical protein
MSGAKPAQASLRPCRKGDEARVSEVHIWFAQDAGRASDVIGVAPL